MRDTADEIKATITAALPRLRALGEDAASTPRGPGKWSPKEVLGHLVDSAVNNHQRFVRAQLADELVFPAYAQEEWVAAQSYNERSWEDVIVLWHSLNLHLAHVTARLPVAARATVCRIGANSPLELQAIVRDYVVHLRRHLAQILD